MLRGPRLDAMIRRTRPLAVAVVPFFVCLGGCRTSTDAARSAGVDSATKPASSAPAPSSGASADVFPLPPETVQAVVNPQGLPVYNGPTGSVEGTIRVVGPPAPPEHVDVTRCPAAIDTYGKLFREGVPSTPGGPRALPDAVVVAVGTADDSAVYVPEKEPAVRVTIGPSCAYPLRTVAMTFGQRLEVANQSRMPFAPTINRAEDTAIMVAPPEERGAAVKLYPRQAGYALLGDKLEPFVHEDLYVFRHPMHAVSDLSGHYRIDGVPVGIRKVGAHHPGINADADAQVDVVEGIVQNVDLTITYKPAVAMQPSKTDAGPGRRPPQ